MDATLAPTPAPTPTLAPDPGPSPSGPADPTELPCRLAAGRSIILEFVSDLERAAAVGGTLEITRLRQYAEDFLDRFRVQARPPSDCVRLHQALLWDERRHHAYERLIVRRFAHLLPKRAGDDGLDSPPAEDPPPLSRRLIPGLTVALVKMMGIDHLAGLERGARALIEVRHQAGEYPIDWAALARSAEARALVDEGLLVMAPFFIDLPRRLHWLCEVVNGHLPPPPPEDGNRHWILTEPTAARLMGALYVDLLGRLRQSPQTLEAAFGATAVRDLVALAAAFERLEQAGFSGYRAAPAPSSGLAG